MIISLTVLVSHVGFHNMAYGLVVLVVCQCISLLLTRLDARFTVCFFYEILQTLSF
jgi:hypothetical protein